MAGVRAVIRKPGMDPAGAPRMQGDNIAENVGHDHPHAVTVLFASRGKCMSIVIGFLETREAGARLRPAGETAC